MQATMRLVIFVLPILANLSLIQGYEDEDCKWEKRIKYVMDYVPTCCKESRYDWITKPGDSFNSQVKCSVFRDTCEYKTAYKEVCADERKRVCEGFWQDDGYGGKFWSENPDKCHWLEESECMTETRPKLV